MFAKTYLIIYPIKNFIRGIFGTAVRFFIGAYLFPKVYKENVCCWF